jgi:Domain of unknown function (DUF4404)
MNTQELKALLGKLQQELESGAPVEPDLREQLRALDQNIQQALAGSGSVIPQADTVTPGPLLAQAQAIEAQFEAEHPTLASLLRNMMDTLGKMGI